MNQYNLVIFLISTELLFIVFLVQRIIISKNKYTSFLFEPIVLFLMGSSAIYLFIPLLMMVFNWNWHNIEYSMGSYIEANLFVFGYIVAVFVLYYIFYFTAMNRKRSKNNTDSKVVSFNKLPKKKYYLLLFLFFTPVMIATFYLLNYVFSFNIAEYLKNRIILRKGMGPVILISYMATLIIPILFAHLLVFIKKKKKHLRRIYTISFFIFFVTPFIIAYVVMGNRLTAFILLVMLGLTYILVQRKEINSKFVFKLIIFLVTLFILFSFLGLLRLMQITGEIENIDANIILSIYEKEIENAFVLNFGNFEHLVWLMENDNHWDYLFGKTFLAGFLNVIPRSIAENKLLGGGPNLKNIIHPGSYDLSKANISSFTTGLAIETYMNFKYFGLIIIPFFHALILFILKYLSSKIRGNIILLSIYLYLLFSFTFLIMFGEFLGIYTRTLIVSLPFILFYLLTSKTRLKQDIITVQ